MKKVYSILLALVILLHANAQNVGIGTTTPIAALDVHSNTLLTSKFNSTSNNMFVGFYENNSLRGYLGSFAGAVEDFDIGTSSSNTNGKLHFTTLATPRMSITSTGNVGIGTVTPVEKLDITGSIRMTGELKPNGLAGTSGQVLTSNGNGTMQWSSLTSTSGTSSGNGGWGDCSIYNIDSFQAVSNTEANTADYFGYDVAISGNYAIIGARGEDNGGALPNTGSATFFTYNTQNGNWESQNKFFNTNAGVQDNFGCSVAIWGDYAIVGSDLDDEAGFSDNGSASIFKRNAATGIWESQGKLINSSPASQDYFGRSVAIYGDYAIVGAYYDDEGGFTNSGSATIFKRNAATGVWESQGKLTDPTPGNEYKFGSSVSIYGDYAIVGAPNSQYLGTSEVGIVCIFKRNAASGVWEYATKLAPPNTNNQTFFGWSVSVFDDYLAVGAYGDDNTSAGIFNTGSVCIYKLNSVSGSWILQTRIFNAEGQLNDWFGWSVSMNDNYLIIGAPQDDMNGNTDAGSCTILKRTGSLWLPHQKFSYPSANNVTNFGISAAVDNQSGRFVTGAIGVYNYAGAAFFGKSK